MTGAGGPEARPGGLELRVGGRLWLDGQGWEVAELTGTSARLQAGDTVRTVSISSLVGRAVDQPEQADPSETGRTWDVPAMDRQPAVLGVGPRRRDAAPARPRCGRATTRSDCALGSARRARAVDQESLVKVADVAASGMALAQLEAAVVLEGPMARAAVLALLWSGRWSVDLAGPLSPVSELQEA